MSEPGEATPVALVRGERGPRESGERGERSGHRKEGLHPPWIDLDGPAPDAPAEASNIRPLRCVARTGPRPYCYSMELRERYFTAAEAEWPVRRSGNLRFYLDYLFEGVDLRGARVLDIGAGGGRFTFYAAAAGAARVVALEPEADGSDAGVTTQFEHVRDRLGLDSVELRHETLQEFDPGDELFDVFFMHASINHLDEPATMRLHTDEAARQVYRELFAKLAGMGVDGAKLVASDASRHNLVQAAGSEPAAADDRVGEAPAAGDLDRAAREAGFTEPRVRWSTANSLRRPGRMLLGNRMAAWFTEGAFCLTMTLRR